MNIVLIGLMGAGKTTIGRKLAQRLGYHFLDMDDQIEQEAGCAISDIFEYQGETHFRALETKLLSRMRSLQNTVISTGGGAIMTQGNLELMRQIGTVIYLKAPKEVILERVLRSQHRPLLKVENPTEKITSLLDERMPYYEQADHIVDTQNLSPHRIASQIIRYL